MQLAKETLARHAGLEQLMPTSLQGIAKKAKQEKKYRFRNLYRLINEGSLREAWTKINKKAAAGVDRVTAKEFEKNLVGNIRTIANSLKKKSYKAKLVRRVNIPKEKGKTRPLGIPALADKLVQRVAAQILEAIYEQDFGPNSYGYRPKVGAREAVVDLTRELQFRKYSYIVEADIKGFFDNINHDWLIRMLELRIEDKVFLRLIKKWLKAGVMDTGGRVIHPATGCPQGGLISPILANIYLHYSLDLWFEKVVKPNCMGEAYLCRYADDFICAFRYKRDAEKFYDALGKRLRKFSLELAAEKTNIISFTRSRKEENTFFEFLGFEYRWKTSHKGKDLITRRTSRKKLRKSLRCFKEWCKENRNNRLQKTFDLLKAKLRGYYNYYGVIGNGKSLNKFYETVKKILFKWLNRRSQRHSFNWQQFSQLLARYDVPKPKINEKMDNQMKICFA